MPIDYQRAAKSAARYNKRLAANNPLFAAMGALEEVAREKTPEDVIRNIDRDELRHARFDVCVWVGAFLYLRQAQSVFGTEEVRQQWAYCCKVFPVQWQGEPSRLADYWHTKLRQHFGTYPTFHDYMVDGRFFDPKGRKG